MLRIFGLMACLFLVAPAWARDVPPVEDMTYQAWNWVEPGGRTTCSDGSPYRFFARPSASDKLVIYFNGGGACWSGETCDPEAKRDYTIYVATVGSKFNQPGYGGIFDQTRDDNPLRDWSMVVATYCTGDVHVGARRLSYKVGDRRFQIEHKGAVNAKAVLDWTFRNFRKPKNVLVTGSSAGGIGAAFFAGTVARNYRGARVSVLSDGAGAYRTPAVVTLLRDWGARQTAPAWMRKDRATLNIEAFFKANARAFPRVRQVQYNNALDWEQAAFLQMLGGGPDVETGIRLNLEDLRAAAPAFRSYTAAGKMHTVLGKPEFYTLETADVPLRTWVADFVEGRPVSDVDCKADANGCSDAK
jgi:hypothetical protein